MKPSIPPPSLVLQLRGPWSTEDVVEGKGEPGLGPVPTPLVQAAGDSVALATFLTIQESIKCLRTSYVLVPVLGTVLEDLTRVQAWTYCNVPGHRGTQVQSVGNRPQRTNGLVSIHTWQLFLSLFPCLPLQSILQSDPFGNLRLIIPSITSRF